MYKYPKVSVITAVYNGAQYVRYALDSLLMQTYKNFEVIIIDDGSTDNTQNIVYEYVKKYPKKIIYLFQNNMGPAAARNKGIKKTKGKYIAILDADDIALPDRFDKQVKHLEKNLEIGLLGTKFIKIDKEGGDIEEIRVPLGKDVIKKHLLVSNAFCHSSVMFRKSCIEKVGGYDESFKYAHDYDLYLRISEVYEVDNYPEILQKWRYNTKASISVKHLTKQNEYAKQIRKNHIKKRLKNGLIDYKYLTELAHSNPYDKLIVSFFFEEYEKLKNHDVNNHLTYLQLKYLYEDQKWKYLNEIGQLYISQDKKSIAFMCLVESLRLNPKQPRIFELAELHSKYITTEYTENLLNRIKSNNVDVENKAALYFIKNIIKNYYIFCEGKIAIIKYYIYTQDYRNASELYADIIKKYDSCSKTKFLVYELKNISKHFNNRQFSKVIMRDFLLLDPKTCIKEAFNNKSISMLLNIIPYFPLKIARSLTGRTKNYIKHRVSQKTTTA